MAESSTTTLTERLSPKRKAFLHGIFTTALEGGIGYWSRCSEYHWRRDVDDPGTADFSDLCDIDGFYATIVSASVDSDDRPFWGVFDDERENAPLRIDLEVIDRGVRLFLQYCHGYLDSNGNPAAAETHGLPEGHYWRQFVVAEATLGDGGDYDADVADEIVQWGLFGKPVYG